METKNIFIATQFQNSYIFKLQKFISDNLSYKQLRSNHHIEEIILKWFAEQNFENIETINITHIYKDTYRLNIKQYDKKEGTFFFDFF